MLFPAISISINKVWNYRYFRKSFVYETQIWYKFINIKFVLQYYMTAHYNQSAQTMIRLCGVLISGTMEKLHVGLLSFKTCKTSRARFLAIAVECFPVDQPSFNWHPIRRSFSCCWEKKALKCVPFWHLEMYLVKKPPIKTI